MHRPAWEKWALLDLTFESFRWRQRAKILSVFHCQNKTSSCQAQFSLKITRHLNRQKEQQLFSPSNIETNVSQIIAWKTIHVCHSSVKLEPVTNVDSLKALSKALSYGPITETNNVLNYRESSWNWQCLFKIYQLKTYRFIRRKRTHL